MESLPGIYVRVSAETWKPRGRFLYDIQGSIFKKLSLAGFPIVRESHEDHEFTLDVQYRERRGPEYAIGAYGTIIDCSLILANDRSQPEWDLQISEASVNSISGPPPYVDAIERFESNPYYFFLGDMLRAHIVRGKDTLHGLMEGLEGQVVEPPLPPFDQSRFKDAPHSMAASEVFYATPAIRRAIDLLVEAGEPRVRHTLKVLVRHHSPIVRSRVIEAFGALKMTSVRELVLAVASQDSDPQVRTMARAVARRLGESPSF